MNELLQQERPDKKTRKYKFEKRTEESEHRNTENERKDEKSNH
jgi:hypothetical protein